MKEYNCSIRVHSRHHLELKTEYPLAADTKKNRIQDGFLFFLSQPAEYYKKKDRD